MDSSRYCVKPGSSFRLKDRDPDAVEGIKTREEGEAKTAELIGRLPGLQQRLYAEGKRSLLIILQAMDAGGKDGTIRRVMSVLNPQGCRVTSFKAPSSLELSHDFLWRIHRAAPARGEIGIFNRSQYEDVLIVRVRKLAPRSVWTARYEQINRFEDMLTQNDTTIVKLFLHISHKEQRKRLVRRIEDPARNWKFDSSDLEERKFWPAYRRAYEEVFQRCSTEWAPWYIVPADRKWFRDLVVARILCETLERMNPQFPKHDGPLPKPGEAL